MGKNDESKKEEELLLFFHSSTLLTTPIYIIYIYFIILLHFIIIHHYITSSSHSASSRLLLYAVRGIALDDNIYVSRTSRSTYSCLSFKRNGRSSSSSITLVRPTWSPIFFPWNANKPRSTANIPMAYGKNTLPTNTGGT